MKSNDTNKIRTIRQTHEELVSKKLSVKELVSEYTKTIEEKNPEINAYLETYDDLDSQIELAQKKVDGGGADLLTGIPLANKDNILIRGKRATAASKMLQNYVAAYDATVIERLKKSAPIFLGRTNMDEFAMGASTENSAFGVTRNPRDTTRVPGGSSGGSAAAVAMGGALAALGSDTGGSIRQPAAFCGCVGFKPTYGAVSRYGLIAMASSLDQIGPITNSVEDAEIIFRAIAGRDERDATTYAEGIYSKPNKSPKKIGVPEKLLETEGLDQGVVENVKSATQKFKDLGYEIVPVDLPNIGYALATYYIIVPAEVSSNLARFDGMKYGVRTAGKDLIGEYFESRRNFGQEARRRIMLGTYVLSAGYYDAYYGKATAARKVITGDFLEAFKKVDAILMPTTPAPAFKIGEKVNDPLQMYLEDVFTVPANIAGIPSISLPSGEVGGLPVGVQLLAKHGHDDVLFALGKQFLEEI